MRTEKDYIGEIEIPPKALYGIHALRAKNNFPDTTKFSFQWYKAIGLVKKACYLTYQDFKKAAEKNYNIEELPINFLSDEVVVKLIDSAEEISEGKYFDNFIVPAIQGGAGTSINMNINEIISNVSLKKLGFDYGDYQKIDPVEAANVFQSTNDVIPTSLKVASMIQLNELEESINQLRFKIEELERQNRNVLRMGYTQLQEAVPTSFGKMFSSYNDALGRDWWRISKCFERIKVVNLGGSAIGTSITVPRFFVMEVVQNLRKITDLPVTKSENLNDATANVDGLVEVHGILKAHAVNLEKISSDIRLLASDLVGNKEIEIPQKQVGSSIMPSKVNPVIVEFIVSVTHKVYANDVLINQLAGQGQLELNPNLPLIGHSILESLTLLIAADNSLNKNLFSELKVNAKIAEKNLYLSPSITTALIPFVGYNKSSEISKLMRENKIDVFKANDELRIVDTKKIVEILSPDNLLKNGFSLKDII
ncbi:MAG: lyase family protein [Bacteroidota bacterium]|nr:lyase family protein [Bacteroidota bacterium]